MTETSSALANGRPHFASRELASLAETKGNLAAWRQLIEQQGVAAIRQVSGEFAVGFEDGKGRGYLAVDRFAIRTLCYRIDGGNLRFAERADELADTSTGIDPQAIYDYFHFHAIPSPRTIFQGVHRLPPGHYAVFEKGTITVKPYWVPEFSEPSNANFNDLKDQFLQLLQDSVLRELDGGKQGCFLSGGTDSSTVAGMIARASGRRASSYSIGFEADGYDEMAYARIAARHFDTDHHEYYVTPSDLVRSIPDVARHYDQPFGNSSVLPAYYCAKMAREDGVTRILAGDGGDELFGGNARYAKQRLFDAYRHIPRFLRNSLVEPLTMNGGIRQLPFVRKMGSYVEQARLSMPDRLELYNLITRLDPVKVLTPNFLSQVDRQAPLRLQREVWNAAQTRDPLNLGLAFDWRFTLAESDLPKVRGSTQLAGIEVGFPMLDQEIVDFSCKLPVDYKLKGLKLRWFFKAALKDFLPDEIIRKKKQGFGLPFGVWLLRDDALMMLAKDSVNGLAERGIMSKAFVRNLFADYVPSHPGYFGEMVWIAMMLEQWMRGRGR